MPIITTQRRMAEQGRIRLGHKITGTNKQGKEYTRPAKLERFRFTSPSQRLIEEIAAKYGGEARPWDNDGKAEWEVLSDATAIPVIVVKGGFSQWHEFWTKGGCQHRCDGEKDAAGNFCDPNDPQHLAAIEKPTTRLSVMLSEIESLGVWRMESKGWNAAAELPSMAELAMHVGDLVPATLGLAERSSVIQTDRGPQTSRYVVPFLDLHVTKQRLVEIVAGPGGGPAEFAAPVGTPALEAGRSHVAAGDDVDEWRDRFADAADVEEFRAVWHDAVSAGVLGTHAPATEANRSLLAHAQELGARLQQQGETAGDGGGKGKPAPSPATPPESVPDEGVVEGELVDDTAESVPMDADAVWADIVRAAASRGLGRLPDLEDDVALFLGGTSSAEASAGELAEYLADLTKRPEVAA